MTPHILYNIVEMQLSILRNDTASFLHVYEEKKVVLDCILTNFMHEMGSIHQHAGELYMSSSTYDKAHSSLIEACKCWKQTGDSHTHEYCVKLLYIVKMLHGSTSSLEEDFLGDISPSEAYTIVKVFEAFQSDDISVFEKYMNEIVNEEAVVMKEGIVKIRRELQERIMLKELPEMSRVQLSDLSSKMNGLALTKITSLIMSLICEKKLLGRLTFREYIGSQFVPASLSLKDCHYNVWKYASNQTSPSYVADSNHIISLGQSIGEKIEVFTSRNGSRTAFSLKFCQWPGRDVTLDCKKSDFEASLLAHGVANIVQEAYMKYPSFARHIDITSFEFDELGMLMSRFLKQKKEFENDNVSSFVDIGYHYTEPVYAASIRSTGLRCSQKGAFGPGVYTADNFKAFASDYGSVGLIVLRLQGKTKSTVFDKYGKSHWEEGVNTVLGNKNQHRGDDYKEVVLQSSSQCVPIIIFDAPICNRIGKECIHFMRKSLQTMLNHFLGQNETRGGTQCCLTDNISAQRQFDSQKPTLYAYNAPDHLADSTSMDKIGNIPQCKYDYKHECPICLDELGSNPNVLRSLSCTCIHIYHQECIQKSFELHPRCPTCQAWVREPQGKSPSGTMRIKIIPDKCSGYIEDTIVIRYQVKSAFQKQYHPNPDVLYNGKDVKAYLPNNDDGMKLLKRLKYAFEHGLTFTVGTSMTTGRKNQCTWASIHHKTSLTGGTAKHGYPDASYFLNCNEELDVLGVPPADDIQGHIDLIR